MCSSLRHSSTILALELWEDVRCTMDVSQELFLEIYRV
jgi:hypothetical protein